MTDAEERAMRAQFRSRAATLKRRARVLASDVRDLLRDVATSRSTIDRSDIHNAAASADACADHLDEVR